MTNLPVGYDSFCSFQTCGRSSVSSEMLKRFKGICLLLRSLQSNIARLFNHIREWRWREGWALQHAGCGFSYCTGLLGMTSGTAVFVLFFFFYFIPLLSLTHITDSKPTHHSISSLLPHHAWWQAGRHKFGITTPRVSRTEKTIYVVCYSENKSHSLGKKREHLSCHSCFLQFD